MPERAQGLGEIHWFEWKPESFELARILDRPILLDLTAVWCHWCRMMEEVSYRDAAVVALANELFVPVRVNTDKRPDISERYNFGGVPTTAVLTPEGETIGGGTYLSAEELKSWLLSQSEFYRAQKSEIKQRIASFVEEDSTQPVTGEISDAIVGSVQLSLDESFDRVYGGFGTQPKFPLPDALDFAVFSAVTTGKESFRKMVTKTLDEMTLGGLFDRVDGGFHRYSATRDWGDPHFEKLLEGNAALLWNYVSGYKLTGEERYKRVGERTLEYLLRTLRDGMTQAFYGSQAADEEFYKLSKEDRSDREPPAVDKTVYTDWNARAIASMVEAAPFIRDGAGLLSTAQEVADFLFSKGWEEERGMHHYFDPNPFLTGLLSDNLEMAFAFLKLHMATGDLIDLEKANALARLMMRSFWDNKDGGFYYRVGVEAEQGPLRRPEKDLHKNSLAAEFFLKLGTLLGDIKHLETARHTLELFTESYSELGPLASCYARSVKLAIGGFIRIEVMGSMKDHLLREFLNAASGLLEPRRLVVPLDSQIESRHVENHNEGTPETYAVVRTEETCSQPIFEPAGLANAVAAAAATLRQ